jgi:hypothetical protein
MTDNANETMMFILFFVNSKISNLDSELTLNIRELLNSE